jgi:hypothetical protein
MCSAAQLPPLLLLALSGTFILLRNSVHNRLKLLLSHVRLTTDLPPDRSARLPSTTYHVLLQQHLNSYLLRTASNLPASVMQRSASLGSAEAGMQRTAAPCRDCGKPNLSADHLSISRVRTGSLVDSTSRPTVRLGAISDDLRPVLSPRISLRHHPAPTLADGTYGCKPQRSAPYPDPKAEESRCAKRRFIVKEIIETERTFVGHLRSMLDVRPFPVPLLAGSGP